MSFKVNHKMAAVLIDIPDLWRGSLACDGTSHTFF